MKKNVASQSVGAQIITAADGTAFTGTVTVLITIDNGTQSASGGTAPAHEGNGYHSYTPTQAETNGDHVAFTFTGTGAIPATVQVFTMFPQTVDNASGIADIPTVAEFNARTLLAASYFDPAADTVANVTLVATTTTNTDMRGTDSANTVVPPSVAQFNARTILAADYFDPATDAVANVTLCATTTTNTDMRGTDGANTTVPDAAGIAPTAVEIRQEMDSNSVDLDAIQSNQTTINNNVLLIDTAPMRGTDSAFLAASAPTNFSALGINVGGDISVVTLVDTTTANTDMVAEPVTLLTTQMSEAYAADGTAPTLAQALFLIQQTIGDFSIAGTTITTKQLNGSTTAATYTLDDGTNPTSRTRTT